MNNYSTLRTLFVAAISLGTQITSAQSPIPYNPTVRNYAYVGKTGYNANVATISLHHSSNPSAYDGGFDTGQAVVFTNDTAQDLNGAGISRVDGYMYAIEYLYAGPSSTSARLYRVGANAVATSVGIIPAPTSADAGRTILLGFVNLASGTIDSQGNYWFNAYTYTNLNPPYTASKMDMFLGKVSNLNQLSALTSDSLVTVTYYKLDISDTTLQTGFTNMMTQQAAMIAYSLPPTNADGGWQDMDITASGQFYSYIGFPSAPSSVGSNPYPKPSINSHLVRIDQSVTPWKVIVVNATPNTTPNREEDGAYFDGAGNFYIVFTDGAYTKVNLSTGALDTLTQSSLPLFNGNMRGDLATNIIGPSLNPSNPLPIQLLSFSAQKRDQGNELIWTTSQETAFDHFELQRSTDARDFSTMGNVLPKGSNSRYNYLDSRAEGTQFYRLKMVSLDGTFTYSSTIVVNGNSDGPVATIYPTILSDNVLHLLTTLEATTLSIYSLNGAVLQSASFTGLKGANQFNLPLNLLPGTYIAHITDAKTGNTTANFRFIIP